MDSNSPLIIAGTYQVISQIGSGGGGVVYLAEHLRLNKKVVLKADRRDLSTKQEVLRREVDSLKDLSHTYIPQVYDFVAEEGTVYTVMDYIDGESFNKPLKRGERFTQAQVIEWACQLLEALDYLHSRPPHGILHADIKPSNVMLTPQGDVRLIDFNIALALGEEGAIAVGRSFGYASPEHYGLDFSSGNATRGINTNVHTDLSSETISYVETILETQPELSSSGRTSSKKTIMLDVRSDIYSLGATLYHIMTGERPAQDATKVTPISAKEYSPAVIAIIAKAMDPDSDLRYQSAEEMLHAFEHLRDTDERVIRWKRKRSVVSTVLALTFIIGGFTAFAGVRQAEQAQRKETELQRLLAEEQRVEAEAQRIEADRQRAEARLQELYVLAASSSESLRSGDRSGAIEYALKAIPRENDADTPYIAEAQKALTDALNVYDLADGFKRHKVVELPSAPLYMQISPSGETAAAVYAYNVAVFDTDTGEIVAILPAEQSALSEVEYLSEDVILYAGDAGIKAYNITQNTELWTGRPTTAITISADGKFAAGVYKNEQNATIYDTSSGQIVHEVDFDGKYQHVPVNDSFANPGDNLLTLNKDGSMLGASFADGSLWVYDLQNADGDLELMDNESGYVHFEGGFHGQYLAFAASNSTESIFAVIDTVSLEQTGGFDSTYPFSVQADENGIYLQTENILVNIHPVTGDQTPLVTVFEEITRFAGSGRHTLITTKGEYMFFDEYAHLIARHEKEHGSEFIQIAGETAIIGSLDAPAIRIMKYENHPESELFAYDPAYRHDEARLSADGTTVMLFSYDQFRLYGMDGEIITDVSIPDANQLYDQQYIRDEAGSRLEVIYNDGTVRAYSAQDGSELYSAIRGKPDLTLYEEFFTDALRIESPLHGTPAAYDKASGKLIRELEQDAYLAYAKQVGEYVITEYVTAEGDRYGLLLTDQCETLAYLPYLCDIVEGVLIFDYPTGNLRKSRIFHTTELIEHARKQLTN